MIGPLQRPLPDNTQHSQETDIHASGGIRTRKTSRRAVADRRLGPRGHRDRATLDIRVFHLRSQVTKTGKIHLTQYLINNYLRLRAQRIIYSASIPSQTGDSDATILRPLKQQFFILLSSHHPNNPLENTSISFTFPSSTQQPKLYSQLEKNIRGYLPSHPALPSDA